MPNSRETPLNDGMIIGTREVLRQARQSDLSDEILSRAVSLDNQKMRLIQDGVLNMLR